MTDDRARKIYDEVKSRVESRFMKRPHLQTGDVCIVLSGNDRPGELYTDDVVTIVGRVSKAPPGIWTVKLVHRYPREREHRIFGHHMKKLPPLVALARQAPSKSSS